MTLPVTVPRQCLPVKAGTTPLAHLNDRRDIAATLPRCGSESSTSTTNAELSAGHHGFVKIIVSANYPLLW
jgi:hypothetical protein